MTFKPWAVPSHENIHVNNFLIAEVSGSISFCNPSTDNDKAAYSSHWIEHAKREWQMRELLILFEFINFNEGEIM
jgi:hypothetical protein